MRERGERMDGDWTMDRLRRRVNCLRCVCVCVCVCEREREIERERECVCVCVVVPKSHRCTGLCEGNVLDLYKGGWDGVNNCPLVGCR